MRIDTTLSTQEAIGKRANPYLLRPRPGDPAGQRSWEDQLDSRIQLATFGVLTLNSGLSFSVGTSRL